MKSASQKELEKLEREYESLLWENLEQKKIIKTLQKENEKLYHKLNKCLKA